MVHNLPPIEQRVMILDEEFARAMAPVETAGEQHNEQGIVVSPAADSQLEEI
jgi:hypothetical protein